MAKIKTTPGLRHIAAKVAAPRVASAAPGLASLDDPQPQNRWGVTQGLRAIKRAKTGVPLGGDTRRIIEAHITPEEFSFLAKRDGKSPEKVSDERVRELGLKTSPHDTVLARITVGDARILKARGGSGVIDPLTKLPHFDDGGGDGGGDGGDGDGDGDGDDGDDDGDDDDDDDADDESNEDAPGEPGEPGPAPGEPSPDAPAPGEPAPNTDPDEPYPTTDPGYDPRDDQQYQGTPSEEDQQNTSISDTQAQEIAGNPELSQAIADYTQMYGEPPDPQTVTSLVANYSKDQTPQTNPDAVSPGNLNNLGYRLDDTQVASKVADLASKYNMGIDAVSKIVSLATKQFGPTAAALNSIATQIAHNTIGNPTSIAQDVANSFGYSAPGSPNSESTGNSNSSSGDPGSGDNGGSGGLSDQYYTGGSPTFNEGAGGTAVPSTNTDTTATTTAAPASDAYTWFKNLYGSLAPERQDIANAAGTAQTAANTSSALDQTSAGTDRATYDANFTPTLNKIVSDANTFDSEGEANRLAQEGEATVGQQYGVQQQALGRQLQSYGINPTSAKYQAQMAGLSGAEASAAASAANAGRIQGRELGTQKLVQAAQLSSPLAGQSTTEGNAGVVASQAGLSASQVPNATDTAAGALVATGAGLNNSAISTADNYDVGLKNAATGAANSGAATALDQAKVSAADDASTNAAIGAIASNAGTIASAAKTIWDWF